MTTYWPKILSHFQRLDRDTNPSVEELDMFRSQVVGAVCFLDEANRCKVSQEYADELIQRLNVPNFPVSTKAMLSLVDTFVRNTPYELKVRRSIVAEFSESTWRNRRYEDTAAIAQALLDLRPLTACGLKTWQQFYETFASDQLCRNDAFQYYLSASLDAGLVKFFDVLASEAISEECIRCVQILIPTLLNRYRNEPVPLRAGFLAFVRRLNESQQSETYEMLKALDFPIEESQTKKVIPLHTVETTNPAKIFKEDIINRQLSKEILDANLKDGKDQPLKLRVEKSKIAVICSDYMRSTAIQDIQEPVIKLICKINKNGPFQAETVEPRPSITLNEFASGRSPDCRVMCSFPFFLTKHKSRRGYMVAPYGRHKKVYLLAPKRNHELEHFAQDHVNSGNTLNLVELLKFIEEKRQTVYCHANYSMGEMIEQCIEEHNAKEQNENNPIRFAPERLQMREQIKEEEGSFGFVKEYFAEQERSNWIILIDVGDLRAIQENIEKIERSEQNESKPEYYSSIVERQEFFVEHTMEILVGIGFHPDCAFWCDNDMRSQRISKLALSFLKDEKFVDELKKMGIEPFDTSPKSNVTNIKHVKRSGKAVSC